MSIKMKNKNPSNINIKDVFYECDGCKYDLTNRISSSEKELINIMETCGKCKRAKTKKYQSEYKDLYSRG